MVAVDDDFGRGIRMSKQEVEPLLVGVQYVQKRLGISRGTVYNLMKLRKLRPVKIPGLERTFFHAQEIDDFALKSRG